MLESWVKPIDKNKLAATTAYQLGHKIQKYTDEFPDLSKTKIAIIGVGEGTMEVRNALYALSFPFRRLKISDLGDTRKQDASFIIPMIKELLASKIIPIIIGSDQQLTKIQYKAHQTAQKSLNLCLLNEHISYHPKLKEEQGYFLNPIIQDVDEDLFNLSIIGCQSHFVNDNVLADLDSRNFEVIRLGEARSDLANLEPILRDADLLSLNLSVLKNIEAPAVQDQSPSGFFNEEACQIVRYAGMSEKLTSIGFYGYLPALDDQQQTAQVIAQLIWYFLDGVYHRKNDFPVTMSGLTEYIVDFKNHDYQITFWKSEKTNRWWMQVPAKMDRKMRRHRLIPCAYQDYLKACEEELPERLLRAHSRFKSLKK